VETTSAVNLKYITYLSAIRAGSMATGNIFRKLGEVWICGF